MKWRFFSGCWCAASYPRVALLATGGSMCSGQHVVRLTLNGYSAIRKRILARGSERDSPRNLELHDYGFAVGQFGDKSWAEWIMNHVRPDTRMDCFGGHKATAMRSLPTTMAAKMPKRGSTGGKKTSLNRKKNGLRKGLRPADSQSPFRPTLASLEVSWSCWESQT